MKNIIILIFALLITVNAHSQVTIFSDANYQGKSTLLQSGFFNFNSFGSIKNDEVSSVKVDNGYIAILFDNAGDNLSGAFKVLKGNTTILPDFNDITSSIFITENPENRIILYTDKNFKGSKLFVSEGDKKLSTTYKSTVSSLYVPAGYKVTLYEAYSPNFRGDYAGSNKMKTYTEGVYIDLGEMDNIAKGILVEKAAVNVISNVINNPVIVNVTPDVKKTKDPIDTYQNVLINKLPKTNTTEASSTISICTGQEGFLNVKDTKASQYVDVKGKVTYISIRIVENNANDQNTDNRGGLLKLIITEYGTNNENGILNDNITEHSKWIPYGYNGWVSFEFEPIKTSKYTKGISFRLEGSPELGDLSWPYNVDITKSGYAAFNKAYDFMFCLDYEPEK